MQQSRLSSTTKRLWLNSLEDRYELSLLRSTLAQLQSLAEGNTLSKAGGRILRPKQRPFYFTETKASACSPSWSAEPGTR